MDLFELERAIHAIPNEKFLPFGACQYNDPDHPGKSCVIGCLMTDDELLAIGILPCPDGMGDPNKAGVRQLLDRYNCLPKRLIPVVDVLVQIQDIFDQENQISINDFKKACSQIIFDEISLQAMGIKSDG